jgi:putative hemolysin
MSYIMIEILFILLLLIANGVFAMSEIAVLAARKVRLQQLAEGGNESARIALQLADEPERFLPTIQIGITLVGILAGAFGGATIAEQLGARLDTISQIAPYGEAFALGIVVLSITYLSLIMGELVPKRLALNSPERIASLVAKPMHALSRAAAPAVYLLSNSTTAVLKLLRVRPTTEPLVTEDEIKSLIVLGTQAGIFEETEQEMLDRVFRLGDRRISQIMTPRLNIVWLDINDSVENIRRKVNENRFSRFPVCEGNLDNVVGVVKARDMLARSLSGESLDLILCMKPPLFVPESRMVIRVLELFKASHSHIALVIDEHGAIEGLVTINDVMQAIVGDIALAGEKVDALAVQREDGSWLLDGMLPVADFKEIFRVGELPREGRADYQTLAGFVMSCLGRIPSTADHFEWGGLRFEVVDMDGKRVDKVLVSHVLKNGRELI